MKQILIYLGLIVLGVAFGYYFAPEKIKTKLEIKTVEIEKEVLKLIEVNKRKTSTHIIVTEFPDGKKITETFIIDESISLVEIEKEKIVYKDREIVKEKEVENRKSQWLIKASAEVTPRKEVYSIDINRRVLGPIFIGVAANTSREATVGVGIEF